MNKQNKFTKQDWIKFFAKLDLYPLENLRDTLLKLGEKDLANIAQQELNKRLKNGTTRECKASDLSN